MSSRARYVERREVTAASGDDRESLGPCEVLVNTAAVLRPGAPTRCRLPNGTRCSAVNLTGYFVCAQVFGRPDA